MNLCLVCGKPGERVVAWTTDPVRLVLCLLCQERWRQLFAIDVRHDVPQGLRPPPQLPQAAAAARGGLS